MTTEDSDSPVRGLARPVGEIVVRPVPEHRADQALSEVYRDLKNSFGVPWVGVITQALAYYRPFFVEAWKRFQPSARTHYFERNCEELRLLAWKEVTGSFNIEPQSAQLGRQGYSDREIAQIQAVLDIFDYGNPKYLVLATAIKESLVNGRQLGGAGAYNQYDLMPRSPVYQIEPIPVMVEEHHALGGLQDIYEDIKLTLQLPFVNSDYKAMARWPSYLRLAWSALKPSVNSTGYVCIRERMHNRAIAIVENLPYTYRMNHEDALTAGLSEQQTRELIQVISLFQWLLSGLILNVTYFKTAMV